MTSERTLENNILEIANETQLSKGGISILIYNEPTTLNRIPLKSTNILNISIIYDNEYYNEAVSIEKQVIEQTEKFKHFQCSVKLKKGKLEEFCNKLMLYKSIMVYSQKAVDETKDNDIYIERCILCTRQYTNEYSHVAGKEHTSWYPQS